MTDAHESEHAVDQTAVLERVSDGIIVVDTDFRCTYVNQSAVELLDATGDTPIGEQLWDVCPELAETTAAEIVREAMTTQRQETFEHHAPDLDRWFDVSIYPDGERLTLSLSDITERKACERELERTTRRFRTLFENTSEAIYLKNRDGTYQLMNDAAAELFDIESADAVGIHDEELFDAHDADAIREVDQRIIERGESETCETIRHIDGERYVFLDNKFPYRDENGDIIGIMGISRDVTDRKTRERELERQEFLFERIQEIADIGVWEYDPRRDNLTWSEGVRHIHGVDGSYEPTLEDAIEFYHPDDRDEISTTVERALEGEEWRDHELRIVRPDGETRHIRAHGGTITDQDTEPKVIHGVIQDITERERREQDLRELTEEYEALLENAEDAIFFVDVEQESAESDIEFRFERLSPSHEVTSGLTTEAVRGKTPQEVFGSADGAETVSNYHRCVKRREPITYEEELPMPEGDIIWQTKLAPVIVDDDVTRIVGIARDVTDRVEREQTLRRQNERLDEFASVVSHDLRNPLNVAQGRTELLREESENEHLAPLSDALARMESIIDDTLTLARQGDTVAEPKPVDIPNVIGRCWGMVESSDATLDVVDQFTIRGDPDRMQHICENLFRNAVEHGGDTVTVRVGRADDRRIYIEDDGPGIPEAERDAVFEPGHSSAAGGTGFGLTIVKRIAEAHGWSVSLTESDDGGARFEFTDVEIVDSTH